MSVLNIIQLIHLPEVSILLTCIQIEKLINQGKTQNMCEEKYFWFDFNQWYSGDWYFFDFKALAENGVDPQINFE